jgi:hypothetical protein
MPSRALPWLMLPVLLLAACSKSEPEATQAAPSGGGVGAAPQAAAPAAESPASEAPAYPSAGGAAAPAAAPPAATVLVAQDTNWPGVVAEILEFRRKGNTLTAKVRLRNGSPEQQTVTIKYPEVYLMDAANAKKYQVLRDEAGSYIAALNSGYSDQWYEYMKPTEQYTIWAKFPAPPPEVTTINLHLPNVPPFEDVAIQ